MEKEKEAKPSTPQTQKPPVVETEAKPSKEGEDQIQTVPKEEFETLRVELEKTRARQSAADKARKRAERDLKIALKKNLSSSSLKTFEEEEEDEGRDEGKPLVEDNSDEQEKEKARRNILSLAYTTPEYLALITKDETLKDTLAKEPLFILDEWIDAKCALEDAKEYFEKRVQAMKPEKEPEKETKLEEVIPEANPNLPSEELPLKPQKKDEAGMSMDQKILSDMEKTGKKGV